MDWLVEYLDVLGGLVLEEIYVGISSPADLNALITRQLNDDERLEGVLSWMVSPIPDGIVDNSVDIGDKS